MTESLSSSSSSSSSDDRQIIQSIEMNVNESSPSISSDVLLYHRYPIVVGEFLLTKKSSSNNSIYHYQPKRTEMALLYKGMINGNDVQQRARNEMKQYVAQRSRQVSSVSSVDLTRPRISSSMKEYYFGQQRRRDLPLLEEIEESILIQVRDAATETDDLFQPPSPLTLTPSCSPPPMDIEDNYPYRDEVNDSYPRLKRLTEHEEEEEYCIQEPLRKESPTEISNTVDTVSIASIEPPPFQPFRQDHLFGQPPVQELTTTKKSRFSLWNFLFSRKTTDQSKKSKTKSSSSNHRQHRTKKKTSH